MQRVSSILLVLILAALPSAAQQRPTATLTGSVATPEGKPVQNAKVSLVELRRDAQTDSAGAFRFNAVPAGHYHILVDSSRLGSMVVEIDFDPAAPAGLEVILDPKVHREEIVVSASPDPRSASEVYQPISVVNEEQLMVRAEPSLGETLSREPGVTSTFMGPGSSRPVIRGFGGDRIRILEDGVGSGDASNVSPDHAVTSEAITAERIEIVRGPATLLYGSNAVGGVVNVLDGRIPTRIPASPVTGSVDLRYGSAADEKTGAVALNGGAGAIGWHVDYFDRSTDDYAIPHLPDEDHDEEHFDRLENSSIDGRGGAVGLSWIGERGFLGLSFSGADNNYGVPGGHAEHHDDEGEEEEEEEEIRIDMEQRRVDLKGELTLDGFFETLRLRAGRSDYQHVELENGDPGTRFENESWEARVEARHRPLGALNGSAGVQFTRREFAAIGAEAFVPPNETRTSALFLFEELPRGEWTFQAGARYEHQETTVDAADLPDRSFGGVSGSLGAVWKPADHYSVALNVARAVRIPTAEELYSDGPHLATRSFELGDPMLDEERSLGIDVSLRGEIGRLHGELNLFRTAFDGYIFQDPTGTEEDGLPVFLYMQDDATFTGLELKGHYDLWHGHPHHVELEFGGDLVRAELDGGENLPRIPPARLFSGVLYRGERLHGGVEVWHILDQDRTAAFETPTDGYTMLNAHVGYRFFVANTIHDLIVRGRNLTDELALNHVSPLKRVAPLPGRDVTVAWKMTF